VTSDNETLFAWHILPLSTYALHEPTLLSRLPTSTTFTELIRGDPEARIVVNFHGNAGHVAQGWRTDTYLRLSSLPHTHVFTIDYRGFGHSTGSPDERGLIIDAVTLIDHVLASTGINPSRVVILGQSLGTAVASAVTLYYADPSSSLLPVLLPSSPISESTAPTVAESVKNTAPTLFAATILVAPFTSLPSLLQSYRIGGILPILSPLKAYPFLQRFMEGYIVDRWPSLPRLVAYKEYLATNSHAIEVARKQGKEIGSLQILHAVNDRDISFEQSVMLWKELSGRKIDIDIKGKGTRDEVDGTVTGGPHMGIRILEFGGHNRVVTFAPVALAVMRAFDGQC